MKLYFLDNELDITNLCIESGFIECITEKFLLNDFEVLNCNHDCMIDTHYKVHGAYISWFERSMDDSVCRLCIRFESLEEIK